MRIFIMTMDDPLKTNNFIKYIIDKKIDSVVGVANTKGNRLTLSKGKSKYIYILSIFLIMGPYHFFINSVITLIHKFRKKMNKYGIVEDPTVIGYAKKKNIPTFNILNPNSKLFLEEIKKLKPDVIISQSQSILKKEILEIPKIGVINRHNGLLPKNRGRLTPFWVLFKSEKETGVSIHFVDERLDSGKIIVQKKFKIDSKDSFNDIVRKNYEIAPDAMIEALNLLESNKDPCIKNNDNDATYNSTPTFKQALIYRLRNLTSF